MRHFRAWFPAIVSAILIFIFSSIPGDVFPPITGDEGILPLWIENQCPLWVIHHPDKMVHVALYAIFGWLCFCAILQNRPTPFLQAAFLAFVITSLYGASDEWHQSFVPNRSCDFWDWIADCTGSLGAMGLLYPIYRKKDRSNTLVDKPVKEELEIT